jgi:hypothetical protein
MCNLRTFWYCTLYVWMANIISRLADVIASIGYIGRWLTATVSLILDWLLSVGSALGQAILDIALGALATLWNWIAGLDIVKMLYDLLGLLISIAFGGAGVGAIVIAALVDLIQHILGLISTFMTIFAAFKDAMFAAINASSTPSLGMPTCLNEADPLYGICIGFEVIQEVITNFPTVTASIYVFMGVMGILTMMWTADQLGSAADGAG